MNRRGFLGTGIGTVLVAGSRNTTLTPAAASQAAAQAVAANLPSPLEVKLNLKPVMTNIIHTGVWEGPCRWRAVSRREETRQAEARFARWSREIKEGRPDCGQRVNVLEPAHLTFSEDFVLKEAELNKLKPDVRRTDAFYIIPHGSSIAAFEVGRRFRRPIVLKGLNCRNVDIAAYTRSQGREAFVPANDEEFKTLLFLLRARKVFKGTDVLFPTDRGLPAVCSVGSICDLEALKQRHGIAVRQVAYKELAGEMERVLASDADARDAEQLADGLLRQARNSFIDRKYVVRSVQFYQTVQNLMRRHGCNAFTIECFEFCSSRLPERWKITPCLIHSLLRDRGHASSCEGDLGSLLAMRMLMSVAQKSCHQGNSDPRGEGRFRINHSVPSRKMNGYDRPDLPYQLGRFVQSGWGTKLVVDFMHNHEKVTTVARVDPSATKLLVLRGELVGASGWGRDRLGCSVEALIKPPQGKTDEFLKKRLEYGNHLQWVYGDFTRQLRQLGQMLGLEVEVIG